MSSSNDDRITARQLPAGEERYVYVLPLDAVREVPARTVDGRALLDAAWQDRWAVLTVLFVFLAAGLAYALLGTRWYRAEVVMVPAQERSTISLPAGFGGLATLAGIRVGGGAGSEPLAVLRSREFTARFVEERNLLPVLYARKWDAASGRWKDPDPERWPDVRDAVRLFDLRLRAIEDDIKSGLIVLRIEWRDPDLAADWAQDMVTRLNALMRERAVEESEANIAYLKAELAATNVVALQQSIGRLLESELQKLMLARGTEEFSFKVVDRPRPPKRHVWPSLPLVGVLSLMLGMAASAMLVMLRHRRRILGPAAASRS